jgi:RNA polymerase sigma-70 factor, ECF subfamily
VNCISNYGFSGETYTEKNVKQFEGVVMNEKEIISKAKNNVSAFEYLYDKYFMQIYKYVMLRVKNKDVANDIVSEVFYKAMTKLSLFKWRSIPFSSWLYRIAMNEISNHFRKEKKKHKLVGEIMVEHDNYIPEPDYDEAISYDFIHNYIRKLPQRDQDVITLRYFEKKSFHDIAEIIGKNEGYIRVILHRALKKLEQSLPEEVMEDVNRKVS